MLLSKAEITKMLRKAAQVWNENKDYLSEIDSRFGDGDHGVTIGKIAGLIEKSLDGWDDDDVGRRCLRRSRAGQQQAAGTQHELSPIHIGQFLK